MGRIGFRQRLDRRFISRSQVTQLVDVDARADAAPLVRSHLTRVVIRPVKVVVFIQLRRVFLSFADHNCRRRRRRRWSRAIKISRQGQVQCTLDAYPTCWRHLESRDTRAAVYFGRCHSTVWRHLAAVCLSVHLSVVLLRVPSCESRAEELVFIDHPAR